VPQSAHQLVLRLGLSAHQLVHPSAQTLAYLLVHPSAQTLAYLLAQTLAYLLVRPSAQTLAYLLVRPSVPRKQNPAARSELGLSVSE
jgi:hypothetical protein